MTEKERLMIEISVKESKAVKFTLEYVRLDSLFDHRISTFK